MIKSFTLSVLLIYVSAKNLDATIPSPELTTPDYSSLVDQTTAHPDVVSTLGPVDTPLTLEISNFLLDHPDLSAFIVRLHKIAPYQIVMHNPQQSWADDGDGTQGTVYQLQRSDTHRLYLCDGQHQSHLLPTIFATAVVDLSIVEMKNKEGTAYTRTTFKVWVKMKNKFVSGLVRTLKVFLKNTVISKFSKAFFVAGQVGNLISTDPQSVTLDIDSFHEMSENEHLRIKELIAKISSAQH